MKIRPLYSPVPEGTRTQMRTDDNTLNHWQEKLNEIVEE